MTTDSEGFQPVEGVAPEPMDELATDDPDLLVAISQPLRIRLLLEAMNGPVTAKDLAEQLGVPLTRLYYHLNLLEDLGGVKVVATRQVRGITEKQYRATALSYRLQEGLLQPGSEAFGKVVKAVFDATRAELEVASETLPTGPERKQRVLLSRNVFDLEPERRREFIRRLHGLIEEFGLERDEGPGAERYGGLFAVYPMEIDAVSEGQE
ncbi:MAG: winged helix-turn-helix domain-containing protein [Nitriliruptorales bacterium]|nr:winged helix-turn-helix domain-containing protein [Nitriliruptorales bacterium]